MVDVLVTSPQIAGTTTTTGSLSTILPPVPSSANGGGEDAKTYTQAELDRMFGETRKAARKTAVSDLLGELGVKDADELKAIITATRDQQAKELSELQKAQKKIADAERERDTLKSQIRSDRLRHMVEKAATALNFQDPEDAYLRLKDSLKLSDDDAKVDGLDDALKQLAKDKPYLLKPAQASAAAPNINSTAGSGQTGTPLADVVDRKRREYGRL